MKKENWFKRVFLTKPANILLAICFLGLLIICLIPLYRLSLYSCPFADDYSYGINGKRGIETYGGIIGAIKGAIKGARQMWYAWQGTYASIFFMCLAPVIFGEEYHFIGSMFIITMITAGTFTFTNVCMRKLFKAERFSSISVAAMITTCVLMFMYETQQAFYWYNGGVHYVAMHGFFFLMMSSAIVLVKSEKVIKKIIFALLTMLFSFITAGANFVTTLQGLLAIFAVFIISLLIFKNKRALYLIPSLITYVVGFYKNVSAPGNDKRGAYFTEGYGTAESILRSFLEAFKAIPGYTRLIGLAVMIMAVPLILNLVKNADFSFKWPFLVLFLSFCFYATGFTPSLYVFGNAGISRTQNAVKITYMVLLFINEIYLLGWASRKFEKVEKFAKIGNFSWYLCFGILFLVIFNFESNQAGNYSAYGAYYYVHTGDAVNFRTEYLNRIEHVKSSGANVVVYPYVFKPWFLYAGEISTEAGNFENDAMAVFYGKESIVLYDDTKD